MPDRSGPPDALAQIYDLAAQRWKHWDAEQRRKRQAGRAGAAGASKLSPTERRRVVRLRRAGTTLREISRQVGCSISTVRRVLQKAAHEDEPSHSGRAAAEAEATSSQARALGERIARIESILAALSEMFQTLGETRPSRGSRKRSA